jgi:hypothetical protein
MGVSGRYNGETGGVCGALYGLRGAAVEGLILAQVVGRSRSRSRSSSYRIEAGPAPMRRARASARKRRLRDALSARNRGGRQLICSYATTKRSEAGNTTQPPGLYLLHTWIWPCLVGQSHQTWTEKGSVASVGRHTQRDASGMVVCSRNKDQSRLQHRERRIMLKPRIW